MEVSGKESGSEKVKGLTEKKLTRDGKSDSTMKSLSGKPDSGSEMEKQSVPSAQSQKHASQCGRKKLKKKQSAEVKRRRRERRKARLERIAREQARMGPEQDMNFAYIVGYTSAGFPYGVTWEEYEEIERREAQKSDLQKPSGLEGDDDLELPF